MDLPDFDVLVELANRHPDRLEALRRRLVSELIDAAPDDATRRRLEGLQFRVDMERRRARSPLGACVRIYEMMYRSLSELRCSIEAPDEMRSRRNAGEAATVLDYRRPD